MISTHKIYTKEACHKYRNASVIFELHGIIKMTELFEMYSDFFVIRNNLNQQKV